MKKPKIGAQISKEVIICKNDGVSIFFSICFSNPDPNAEKMYTCGAKPNKLAKKKFFNLILNNTGIIF